MFLLFPFIVLASFFGRVKGGNMIYGLCRIWADIALFCWGIHHTNYFESVPPADRPSVFVFNHISYIDIPLLLKAFRRQPIRVLGKAEMAKIPVFGFIYRKAAVLVDRSNPEARAKSVLELKAILRKNISIVLAPEGTFNMTGRPLKEFFDGAFRIAIETGTPIQPVLFLDAYDRMHYRSLFTLTPGRSRAVFLEPVPVEGYGIESIPVLKQAVYEEMESALLRYKATWIDAKTVTEH